MEVADAWAENQGTRSVQGEAACAVFSTVEERMPKQDKATYSFMKISALSGFVSFASEITRKPASPPSRRPSSTSTRTPHWAARSTCGRARAMFSSSVYRMIYSISGMS